MSKPTSSLAELRDQIRLSVYGPGGSEQSEAADCIETAKLLVAILDRLEKVERQLAVLVENTSTENVHD